MTKEREIFSGLVRVLECSHRLGLEEKTDKELQEILREHQKSFCKRVTDFLGLQPPRGYDTKQKAIEGALEYRQILRERYSP